MEEILPLDIKNAIMGIFFPATIEENVIVWGLSEMMNIRLGLVFK